MQTAAPPDSQESGSQPYPRRDFLKRGLAATIGIAALGAESLWRSEPALAYVGCECTVFVPEGYFCAGGVLYLMGHKIDCRDRYYCGIQSLVVGCCSG